MRRAVPLVLVIAAGMSFGVPAAHADPPVPPTPPGCHACGGPPPPPTPVPTLGESTTPSERVVSVELSPLHVHRGGTTKATITASTDDKVTLVVRYHHAKPVKYHGTVGSSGKLVKRWKVPRKAPIGKAAVTVTVDGAGKPYRATASLVVTR